MSTVSFIMCNAWFPALRFRSSVSASVNRLLIVSALPFRSAVAVALTERLNGNVMLETRHKPAHIYRVPIFW